MLSYWSMLMLRTHFDLKNTFSRNVLHLLIKSMMCKLKLSHFSFFYISQDEICIKYILTYISIKFCLNIFIMPLLFVLELLFYCFCIIMHILSMLTDTDTQWWSSVCQTIFSFCVALFRITLNTPERESETEKNYIEWLQTTLLRKLVNWSSEKKLRTSVTSLRLVPVDRYNELYSTLKDKYGRKFVEVHVLILSNSISKKSNPYFICQLTLNSYLFIFFQIWPEKTDPQKFVYEDVAIATYLLVSFCRMLVWYKVFLFLFYSFEECFFSCRSYGKCNGKNKRVKHSKALLTSDVEMDCLFIFSSQKGLVGIYNIFSGYMLTWVRFRYF